MTDPTATLHSSLTGLSETLVDLVARAAPGIVSVRSHRTLSSGFAWRPGLIVTAEEALAEDGDIEIVLPGGDTAAARPAVPSPTPASALLRIAGPALLPPPAAATVAAAALAVALGGVDGEPIAALGIVSRAGGPWRSLRGGEIDARIELDLGLHRRAEGG